MNIVTGDATSPVGEGTKIIAHIVNTLGVWGSTPAAGFVFSLEQRYPGIRKDYLRWSKGDPVGGAPTPFGLGNTLFSVVDADIVVANMVAQRGVWSPNNPIPFQREAFRSCLLKVSSVAQHMGASVHMPAGIGSGRANGNREEIHEMIQRLVKAPTTLYEWTQVCASS